MTASGSAPLRGEPVLVDQPAEKLTAANVLEIEHRGGRAAMVRRWEVARWRLLERSVRPVLVVGR
jgi:hypothetical protein